MTHIVINCKACHLTYEHLDVYFTIMLFNQKKIYIWILS